MLQFTEKAASQTFAPPIGSQRQTKDPRPIGVDATNGHTYYDAVRNCYHGRMAILEAGHDIGGIEQRLLSGHG